MVDKGLVFGKFYPPHRGHLALIEFAREACDQLLVLICCSNKEIVGSDARRSWLAESITPGLDIDIRVFPYDESNLPNTSESSREVSSAWAKQFSSHFPGVNVVISSEPYGDFVAEQMGARHLPFDLDRIEYPISSSDLRDSLLKHWAYLAPGAQRFFRRKVAVLGSESTGKSTLAKDLAETYSGSLVEEVGREVVPNSNTYSLQDLYEIAYTHADHIRAESSGASPLVVADTDVYITQSYTMLAFGKYLNLQESIYQANSCDVRLYLDLEVDYVQDGTRMSEEKRRKLDISHRKTLEDFKIKKRILKGSHTQRTEQARRIVGGLFLHRWNL